MNKQTQEKYSSLYALQKESQAGLERDESGMNDNLWVNCPFNCVTEI